MESISSAGVVVVRNQVSVIARMLRCKLSVRSLSAVMCEKVNKASTGTRGPKPGLPKPDLPSSICVARRPIPVSKRLKILGVMLNSSLTFDNYVSEVVRACNYHLRMLHCIHCSVT